MKLVYQYMAIFFYFLTHFKSSLQHTVQCGWFSSLITRLDTTPTKHSPNAVLMLSQRLRRWLNIEPTLEKCTMFARMSFCLDTHRTNTVSVFAKQCPAKIQDQGLWDSIELLLIDVAQVYMNLLWFENLLLMRLLVWNVYLVLLWNRALAYPRPLLHSGGPLSCEFWQLTIPLK